jgi:HK97 gp10 family phage protein
MQIQIEYKDLDKVVRKFDVMPSQVNTAVRKATNAVAAELKREITGKEGLSKYGRHKKGKDTPSPSDGKSPPAQVTTNLRRSIKIYTAKKIGFGQYSQSVMPTAVYARAQERGTDRLPARPYMKPARDRIMKQKKAQAIFRKYFNDAITGFTNGN